jgi:mannose-1-phosphate guanylyltransferase
MRAMILAAGLGTRLRPLTYIRPKALVPILGTTVLDFWLSRLLSIGCAGVVVNAFHHPEKLIRALQNRALPIPARVQVEEELLGTGGGIRNVLDFFGDEPFVVVNGDVLSDAPLQDLYAQFLQMEVEAGLLLHDYPEFNNVAVDEGGWILGFGEEARKLMQERADVRLQAFTGIHLLQPRVLQHLAGGQPADIIAVYRDMIAAGRPPKAMLVPGLFWREMGSIDAYWALHREMATVPAGFLPPLQTGNHCRQHPTAAVAADVRLNGLVMVGAGSRVLSGSELTDVIVWDDVTIQARSVLRNCLVTDGVTCSGCHKDEILMGAQT